jgi:hypothetical protein
VFPPWVVETWDVIIDQYLAGENVLFRAVLEELWSLIFEILAIIYSIQFWRKKPNLFGVSVRNVIVMVLTTILDFAQLIRNNGTVHGPIVFVALAIFKNYWMVQKVVSLRPGYDEETNNADVRGTRLLFWILLPSLIGYAAYQFTKSENLDLFGLVIDAHEDFAFTFALPQIYVNYRLKTVEGISTAENICLFIKELSYDVLPFWPWRRFSGNVADWCRMLATLILIRQSWLYRGRAREGNDGRVVTHVSDDEPEEDTPEIVVTIAPGGDGKVKTD